MAQRKYRGKYPNRIKAVWGTYNKGVYGLETNNGARYFCNIKDMVGNGYCNCHSQLLGTDATDLRWLHTSIAAACVPQAA